MTLTYKNHENFNKVVLWLGKDNKVRITFGHVVLMFGIKIKSHNHNAINKYHSQSITFSSSFNLPTLYQITYQSTQLSTNYHFCIFQLFHFSSFYNFHSFFTPGSFLFLTPIHQISLFHPLHQNPFYHNSFTLHKTNPKT